MARRSRRPARNPKPAPSRTTPTCRESRFIYPFSLHRTRALRKRRRPMCVRVSPRSRAGTSPSGSLRSPRWSSADPSMSLSLRFLTAEILALLGRRDRRAPRLDRRCRGLGGTRASSKISNECSTFVPKRQPLSASVIYSMRTRPRLDHPPMCCWVTTSCRSPLDARLRWHSTPVIWRIASRCSNCVGGRKPQSLISTDGNSIE